MPLGEPITGTGILQRGRWGYALGDKLPPPRGWFAWLKWRAA
jgi:hypothetical protein